MKGDKMSNIEKGNVRDVKAYLVLAKPTKGINN